MRTVTTRGPAACAALTAVVAAMGGTAVGDQHHGSDLAEARAATAQFEDWNPRIHC
jgi:hypothetical protein